MEFLDFDLLFERTAEGYRCRVLDSPAGEASGTFQLPFSDLELENFFLRIGQPRRDVRRDIGRSGADHQATVETFGGQLFAAVFTDDVFACLRTSLADADRQGAGLRIRLRMAETPELLNLPWEFLRSGSLDRFLALSNFSPIIRYLELPERVRPLKVTPPLRVLAMISAPHDYPNLDSDREWQMLRQSVADLEARGIIQVERLQKATLAALQQTLRRGEYHIFHYIGHGDFDEATQEGRLLLEDETGRGAPVGDAYLGTLLHDHRSLRLVVLNSCEGARTSRTDPFAGTAQTLVKQGIPAVIAMQFEVTDGAAIVFAREFYSAVSDGLPVDAALTEARKAIFSLPNMVEWATPVLYMRADNGAVFDLQQPAAPVPEASRVAPAAPAAAPAPTPAAAPSPHPGETATLTMTWATWARQIGAQITQAMRATGRTLSHRPVAGGAALLATVLAGALWVAFGQSGDRQLAATPTPTASAGTTDPGAPTDDGAVVDGTGTPTADPTVDPAADPAPSVAVPLVATPHGRLVFHSDPTVDRNDDSEIFTYDIDRQTLQQLTDNHIDDWIPSWAARGTKIVFSSELGNTPDPKFHDLDTWMMDADGTDPQRIMGTANWDEYPALSPDGARLAFASTGNTGRSEIFIADVPVALGGVHQITSLAGDAVWPSWSPDGRRLAFSSGPSSSKDLFLLDVASGASTPHVVSPLVETKPAWSPDGEWIAFARTPSTSEDGFGDLHMIRPDGSDERSLTTEGDATDPAWSPDGAWVAFARRVGTGRAATTDLWAVRIADGKRVPLLERPGRDLAPSWTE